MSVATLQNREGRGFGILNSDFCLLASQAAIELENLKEGKASSLSATKEVAELLKVNLGPSATEPLGAMPGTFTVVNNAISGPGFDQDVTTVNDVITKVFSLIDDLGNAGSEKKPEADLDRLCEFCASLSLVTSSFLQDVYASRPRHPFRS